MKITNLEPQKKYKNRLNVYIDGEFAFGIDEFDAARLRLKEGKEITEAELCNIKNDVLFSSAKDYALKLVSTNFYTEHAVKNKLKNRKYDDETIERTIVFLKEYNFINDIDYAKKYIEECVNIKKYGKHKIKAMLKEKGISSEITEDAMSYYDFEETESRNLFPLMKKKLGGNFDYKNTAKAKRYFVSHGYDYAAVDSVLKAVIEEESIN